MPGGRCLTFDYSYAKNYTIRYLSKVRRDAQNLSLVEERVFRFNSSELKSNVSPYILKQVGDWEQGIPSKFLYVFYFGPSVDIQEAHRLFFHARTSKLEGRAYAKLNKQPSACLYVGNSANLSTRLRDHLGYGAKATYAMQLLFWAKDLNAPIDLRCWRFHADADADALQALEDRMWELLKPMLGKQGKK